MKTPPNTEARVQEILDEMVKIWREGGLSEERITRLRETAEKDFRNAITDPRFGNE